MLPALEAGGQQMPSRSGAGDEPVTTNVNQMIDIVCSSSITRWNAEQDLTQVVCIAKVQSYRSGILAKCKENGANSAE